MSGPVFFYDATTITNIPANAPGVAGYVDGRYANFEKAVARYPKAFHISITVFGRANTMVADCESGDLTPPQAAAWAHAEIAAGRRPTIYCNLSWHDAVAMACAALGLKFGAGSWGAGDVDWWAAYYVGHPYLVPGSVATQFSGGITAPYDINETNGTWPAGSTPVVPSLPAAGALTKCIGGALSADGQGYWLVQADGGVFSHGDATFRGSMGGVHLNAPVVAAAGAGPGYRLVGSDGGVYDFGVAPVGSGGGLKFNAPIVDIVSTPHGGGITLTGADGGTFNFGDAVAVGSLGGQKLNAPVVGGARAHDGAGLWLVGADGGVFAFGTAPFKGSAGNLRLNKPIVGMAATPSGQGYWLVASDGGVFCFGDALYRGSTANVALNQPIVDIASSASGDGYTLFAADGGVFTYGDAVFAGAGA